MSLWAHLVPLAVLMPFGFLLGALACALIGQARIAQMAAMLISLAMLAVILRAMLVLAPDGALMWAFADWAPGARSNLRLDALTGSAALIVTLAAVFSGLAAWEAGDRQNGAARAACLRLAWAGAASGACLCADWLETAGWLTGTGLVLSALIALQGQPTARAAALSGRLFTWNALAGGLVLMGLGLVFANSGSLDPDSVSVMLDGARQDPLAFVGVALVSSGLAVFAGLAPMQTGLAGASGAARLDSALLLIATSFVGFVGFLRMEGAFLAAWGEGMAIWLLCLGGLGAVWAAWHMLQAKDLRAMAPQAWAAQLGLVLVGVVVHGAQASIGHLLASLLAVLALLAGTEALERRFGPLAMDRLHGLGRRAPLAGGAIVLSMLSLTGAPFTFGFVSRFDLMEVVVGSDNLLGAGAMIATSLLALWVAARLIQTLFLNAPEGLPAQNGPGPSGIWQSWASLPLAAIAALACLYFGLAPGLKGIEAPAAILERSYGK